MLDLDVLQNLQLTGKPKMQEVVGHVVRFNHAFPLTRTSVHVEGIDTLRTDRPLFIAMNHTDRYNYWPFQVALWRRIDQFTATWVKGKYYNNNIIQKFMVATNNIPTPSRGYVLSSDYYSVFQDKPSNAFYTHVKTLWESTNRDPESYLSGDPDIDDKIAVLQSRPRRILGYDFDPKSEDYFDALTSLFYKMMDRFVSLNHDAFGVGLQILVFPEGTRSTTLSAGRPGLAQMLLRTKASVVCVGCNGSDEAYPGDSPFSKGGEIVYRVGSIMTPDDELAPFQIDEPYRPFTSEADPYREQFDGCTSLIMERISELLEPRYLSGDGGAVTGANRFL